MFCIKEGRKEKSPCRDGLQGQRDPLPPKSLLPLCIALLALFEVFIFLSTCGVENPRADFAIGLVHKGFLQNLGNTSDMLETTAQSKSLITVQ